jgi:para-aminobenzoate synthetase component 1
MNLPNNFESIITSIAKAFCIFAALKNCQLRKELELCIKDVQKLKAQLLFWGQKQDVFVMLDSSNFREKYSNYDFISAFWPVNTLIQQGEKGAFENLKKFKNQTKDYLFGYLTYDLKNDVENLESKNSDYLHFPAIHFFQPGLVIFQKGQKMTLKYHQSIDISTIEEFLSTILNHSEFEEMPESRISIKNRIPKEVYIADVEALRLHIKRGDIYEANFCQEFYAEDVKINPAAKYLSLNSISTPPFASFYKLNRHYLLSASPERYIKKEGDKVISQPIKGTAKRCKDIKEDLIIKEELRNDVKERAENVMIVDLVRNDLSRTAKRGSVKVEELCEIYSFQTVHQMISTVTSTIDAGIDGIDVISKSFPMGSMTGAPKLSAMKLIERYESSKRGLYSGSVGYFTPDGDFDFNVVIRSILYNSENNYLSFIVGSAITDKSNAEKEFEETILKAKALFNILEKND